MVELEVFLFSFVSFCLQNGSKLLSGGIGCAADVLQWQFFTSDGAFIVLFVYMYNDCCMHCRGTNMTTYMYND